MTDATVRSVTFRLCDAEQRIEFEPPVSFLCMSRLIKQWNEECDLASANEYSTGQ